MNFASQSALSRISGPKAVIGAGLVLGLFGNLLLRAMPWGLNLFVWTAAAAFGALWLLRRIGSENAGRVLLPGAGILLFSAFFVWRDSGYLQLINAMGYFACSMLVLHTAGGRPLVPEFLTRYFHSAARMMKSASIGPLALVAAIDLSDSQHRRQTRHLGAVLRGVLLSLPVLILFATLFHTADPLFARLVDAVVDVHLPTLLEHVMLTLLIAWVVAGVLHGTVSPHPADGPETRASDLRMGGVEASIVVSAVCVLFLTFMLVQLQYLFGGRAHVLDNAGVTFAEYAREGFFQLAAVTAFVLPLMLGLHWLVRDEREGLKRLFNRLAAGLLVLVFVIIASALDRMHLYQSVYGLTQLRFFTTAFIIWLAFVFVWFGATVLRDRRQHFAPGMLISGLAAILVLNTANPDALIAKTNLARSAAGSEVDADYLARYLSADAVPVLIEAAINGEGRPRPMLARGILYYWDTPAPDVRTLNWSRNRARMMTRRNLEALRSVLGPLEDSDAGTACKHRRAPAAEPAAAPE